MDPQEKLYTAFPSVSFYGTSRKRKRIEKKLEVKAAEYFQQVIPRKFPARIIGPSPTWKSFFKQAEAFSYVRTFPKKDLHVFAYESKSFVSEMEGKRLYLIAAYPVFWHYYSQLKEVKRHHYEIIPEGAVCKMYFDVEFYRENNPDLDGHRVCDTLIQYVCAWLHHLFKVPCDSRRVLRLDASTSSKYSEHLVFNLNQAAFTDNYNVGSFVKFICSHLVIWLRQNRKELHHSKPLLQTPADPHPNCTEPGDADPHPKHTEPGVADPHLNHTEPLMQDPGVADPHLNHTEPGVADPHLNHTESGVGDPHPNHTERLMQEPGVVDPHSNHTEPLIQEPGVADPHPNHTDPLLQEVDPSKSPLSLAATTTKDSSSSRNHLLPQPSISSSSLPQPSTSTPSPTRAIESPLCSVVINDEDVVCKPGEVLSQFSLSDLKEMVVLDKDGDETSICDLGVYTKNRNFRLFQSSKLGKKNPLVVSNHSQYSTDKQDKENIFYDSLIANVKFHQDLKILTFHTRDEIKLKQKRLLTLQNNERKEQYGIKGDYSSTPSPYPEIDSFIRTIISSGSHNGRIFRWMYFNNENLLSYDICQYRWCGNIGREHKSNNIRLIVDLKKCVYYQKCHDPDCKQINYRSEDYVLPENVLPWLNNTTLDEDIEDSLMVNALERCHEELDDTTLVEAAEEAMGGMQQDSIGINMGVNDEEDLSLLLAAEEMEKIFDASSNF